MMRIFRYYSTEALGFLDRSKLRQKSEPKKLRQSPSLIANVLAETGKNCLNPSFLKKAIYAIIYLETMRLLGYVAAKVYEKMAEVGPLICQAGHVDVAASLLKAVLGKLDGFKCLRGAAQKRNCSCRHAFLVLVLRKIFVFQECFIGPIVSKNCIYMAESLERG